MFVLLTLNIQRSLYLAEYEILTAGPNYGEYPLLGCDIFRGNGLTVIGLPLMLRGNMSRELFPGTQRSVPVKTGTKKI
jgi:hypothetical protein